LQNIGNLFAETLISALPLLPGCVPMLSVAGAKLRANQVGQMMVAATTHPAMWKQLRAAIGRFDPIQNVVRAVRTD
jgi:hypothetical protein